MLVPIACFMAAHGWQNTGVGGFLTAKRAVFVTCQFFLCTYIFLRRNGWVEWLGFQPSLLAEEYVFMAEQKI